MHMTNRPLVPLILNPIATKIIMEDFPTDEAIWGRALQTSFVPPPRQWIFGANTISFGNDLYHIDEAAVYELALLDIHAQFWEAIMPEHLRRYHRGLQYNVECCFQSNNTLQIHHTPPFLNSWLSRTVFMKLHDQNGREKMSHILKNVSEVQRSKLETGDFQADGRVLPCLPRTSHSEFFLDWKAVITNKHHWEELTEMIKAICSERQISRYGNTQYSWRLPIFDTIQWDGVETLPALGQAFSPAICLLYKNEVVGCRWEGVLVSSSSHSWVIGKTPYKEHEVKRLLDGLWLNDEIVNAYLELCRLARPDIKFLPTFWYSRLETWGKEASSQTISWVGLSFHTSGSLLMRNVPKISKHASDVHASMKMFTAMITVIHYQKDHWITLKFNPKSQILEVFDSLAQRNFAPQKQRFEQVGCVP